MNIKPAHLIDGYKINHIFQYPEGTELVYSNFTPRFTRDPHVQEVVVFGIQYFVREYLKRQFEENFFNRSLGHVMSDYESRINDYCGMPIDNTHIQDLHELGYLPLRVKALPEGTLCPLGTPCITLYNTDPKFFWLVNYMETLMSGVVWGPMTSATTAHKMRKYLEQAATFTGSNPMGIPFQAHDFSMRGMFGLESAALSGAGHLLSFVGTDCIPAIDFLDEYYDTVYDVGSLVGCGVPATEHSVMCAGGEDNERETFRRLMCDVHPTGLLSIVSDSWDYWDVIDRIIPSLKSEIMAREGKVVIRPDSGDPVDIIKRTIPKLYGTFGGTKNKAGFIELDEHIGLIYGDGINYERMQAICENLIEQGFATSNVVFGLGSYTYQYRTRDEYGFAMKATYCEINGEPRNIFKRPKTDTGGKFSHKGLLRVNEDLTVDQEVSWNEERKGLLQTVFINGTDLTSETLQSVRSRLWES